MKDFFAPKQKEKGFFPDKVFEEKEPLKEPDIDLTFNQKSMRLDIEKKKPKRWNTRMVFISFLHLIY